MPPPVVQEKPKSERRYGHIRVQKERARSGESRKFTRDISVAPPRSATASPSLLVEPLFVAAIVGILAVGLWAVGAPPLAIVGVSTGWALLLAARLMFSP